MKSLLWLFLLLLPSSVAEAFTPRLLPSFTTSGIRRATTESNRFIHYSRVSSKRYVHFSFVFNKAFASGRPRNNETAQQQLLEQEQGQDEEEEEDKDPSREQLFSTMFRKREDQTAPKKTTSFDTPGSSIRDATIADYINNRIQAQEESRKAIEELHRREGISLNDTGTDINKKDNLQASPSPTTLGEEGGKEEREEVPEVEVVLPQETAKIDIFGPSLLLDVSSSDTTGTMANQTNTNSVEVSATILNQTQFQEALEILGPMTMSDPSFAIGAGVNVTMINTSAVLNQIKRKPYVPPSLLEALSSYSTLKLPPITITTSNKNGKSSNNNNNSSSSLTPKPVLPNVLSLANASAPTITLATATLSSMLNTNSTAAAQDATSNTSTSNGSNPYYMYDPASALAFLDSQANFTKQQMETLQKIFSDYSSALYDYSTNATKQLDSAQKALLEYGTKALEETAAAVSLNSNAIVVNGITQPQRQPTLSVEELEAYLRLNGYVKQADLDGEESLTPTQIGRGRQRVMTNKRSSGGGGGGGGSTSNSGFMTVRSGTPDTKVLVPREGGKIGKVGNAAQAVSSKRRTKDGRVAFPQPSILSYAKLKWGSTTASAILGLFGGVTIFPNLWLLGAVFGGLYGYDVSKNLAENPPTSALAKVVVYLGRELTKKYLWLYDFCQGLWFMYKTGQLSYDYWKKYAALDQQFAIQAKMDAWNARFQKGKENFDKWERENEVGRKILAGLRTLWLVEEQSKRKFGPKSRYRVVQWCYDAGRYCRRRIAALYAKRGKALKEIQDLAEGMRQELIDPSQWKESMRPRIAAALAALTFVNLTGALFAVSPLLLGVLAVVLGGIVWPTWFSEWLSRVGIFFEEIKAKGRGELFRNALGNNNSSTSINTRSLQKRGNLKRLNSSSSSPVDKPKVIAFPFFMNKQEQERYHYFQRPDGSKRWYRTGGNPWDANSNISNMWGKKKEEEKPWWSLN